MRPVRAKFADVPKLQVFFHQAWEEYGSGALGFTGATEETINEIASEKFLKERLSNPNIGMYIVKEGERVLGFAATRSIDQDALELTGIIVLEDASGKGIGAQLVKEVVSSARKASFRRIVVKTEVLNKRAISFYKKMGLSEIGEAQERVEDIEIDVMILEKII
jgi:ribosomal protein S18 acetylase RimI-like enzyme